MHSYSLGDVETAARVANAMDSPLRLQILLLLTSGEHVVHELVSELGKSQPLISQHLRVLKRANLVTSARRGREVLYSLAYPEVAQGVHCLMRMATQADVVELASRRPSSEPLPDSDSSGAAAAAAIIEPPSANRPSADPGLVPSTPKPKRD
ncbi:ArsR/SmtB family transcription factor [Corynebacterium timonense]|uniref:DNA-binding transcriptional regulator, ArsR family n=1 Tax=Corynebacterium timonense TaxID=441500 RepID=A0A1H1M455_9CORY|nr:metalloregulator ArsR/SmtB family transcription factor [Corynebacterium timonense]SDR81450.1 DNA-binding transcriptional regulator, ArsR family [Corynebacterium timonense]